MLKSIKQNQKSILLLILIGIAFCGCTQTISSKPCAVYPIGGEKVGKELEKIPYNGFENFWEHQARLYKLKQELDLCRNK